VFATARKCIDWLQLEFLVFCKFTKQLVGLVLGRKTTSENCKGEKESVAFLAAISPIRKKA
jgi:hypothetical protein